MGKHDYWAEALSEAMESAGAPALTPEQLAAVAADLATSGENITLAFPNGAPDAPRVSQMDRLRNDLSVERSKVVCPDCRGLGTVKCRFADRIAVSQCDRCRGDGKLAPEEAYR